jgi:hypothetical protein
VLGAVLDYEDVHAKDADPCFADVLAAVPDEEIAAARVLRQYVPSRETDRLRLAALRQLGEAIRDIPNPMPQHGIDILELIEMTPDDLREHMR